MKNKIIIFAFMSFFSLSASANCFGVDVKKELHCTAILGTAERALAINDSAEGITVSMIEDSAIIKSVNGLGYEIEPFKYEGKEVPYKIFVLNKLPVLVLRVKGDTTSLLRLFTLTDEGINLIKVQEKEKSKKFIVTDFGADVSVSSSAISVKGNRYKATYKITPEKIELTDYKVL